jgi:glutathione S-transferase
MIKIYGAYQSSAGRCYVMLEECNLKYERVPLNMQNKEHKLPDYLKLNPNGKVPVMIDGDLVLWESIAINRYLAEKYKPELLGKTIEDRAHVEKWSVWCQTELQSPFVDIVIQTMFVPEGQRDNNVIERAKATYPRFLKVLNDHLEGRDYLVGREFTLADLNTASVAAMPLALKIDISDYKNILKWLKTIQARPSFQKVAELSRSR